MAQPSVNGRSQASAPARVHPDAADARAVGTILALPFGSPGRTNGSSSQSAHLVVVLDILDGQDVLAAELLPQPIDTAGTDDQGPLHVTVTLQSEEYHLADGDVAQAAGIRSGEGLLVRTQRTHLLAPDALAEAELLGTLHSSALARVLR